MLFRFGLVFALTCLLLVAMQQELLANCCESESEKLSSHVVKALLQKTGPIDLPGTVDKLHIKGTVVMELAVDDKGEVNCLRIISGDPLIIGTTIESVRQWKFRPRVLQGLKKGFCGRIAISYQVNEHGMKYKVIGAP